MSLKNPVTRTGIDPGTVRLVAQRLNHYATTGPPLIKGLKLLYTEDTPWFRGQVLNIFGTTCLIVIINLLPEPQSRNSLSWRVKPAQTGFLFCSCNTTKSKEESIKRGGKKSKVPRWSFLQHYSLWLIVLLTPKGVPSFISRGAAHQRRAANSASEGRNYRWNLANNPVIHVSC
jgi:hypothetical protein